MSFNRSFPGQKFQSPQNRLTEERKNQPSFFAGRRNMPFKQDVLANSALKSKQTREQGELPDSAFNDSISALNRNQAPHYLRRPEKGVQTKMNDEFYVSPLYPSFINGKQSKIFVDDMKERIREIPTSTFQSFYGFIEFKIELDKRNCKQNLFAHLKDQQQLKIALFKTLYNKLGSECKPRDQTKDIEFQLAKFRTLGRDYYNVCERKSYQSEQDLQNQIVAKSKPFFEVRDGDIFYSQNSKPIDIFYFKVFSRDWYLKKIKDIVIEYVQKTYEELKINITKIDYFKQRPNQDPIEKQEKVKLSQSFDFKQEENEKLPVSKNIGLNISKSPNLGKKKKHLEVDHKIKMRRKDALDKHASEVLSNKFKTGFTQNNDPKNPQKVEKVEFKQFSKISRKTYLPKNQNKDQDCKIRYYEKFHDKKQEAPRFKEKDDHQFEKSKSIRVKKRQYCHDRHSSSDEPHSPVHKKRRQSLQTKKREIEDDESFKALKSPVKRDEKSRSSSKMSKNPENDPQVTTPLPIPQPEWAQRLMDDNGFVPFNTVVQPTSLELVQNVLAFQQHMSQNQPILTPFESQLNYLPLNPPLPGLSDPQIVQQSNSADQIQESKQVEDPNSQTTDINVVKETVFKHFFEPKQKKTKYYSISKIARDTADFHQESIIEIQREQKQKRELEANQQKLQAQKQKQLIVKNVNQDLDQERQNRLNAQTKSISNFDFAGFWRKNK